MLSFLLILGKVRKKKKDTEKKKMGIYKAMILVYFSPTAPDDNQTEQESNLMDHSDLHVLDLGKS